MESDSSALNIKVQQATLYDNEILKYCNVYDKYMHNKISTNEFEKYSKFIMDRVKDKKSIPPQYYHKYNNCVNKEQLKIIIEKFKSELSDSSNKYNRELYVAISTGMTLNYYIDHPNHGDFQDIIINIVKKLNLLG